MIADNVYFAEPKRDYSQSAPRQTESYSNASNTESPTPASFENGNVDDFREIPMDDDLPF